MIRVTLVFHRLLTSFLLILATTYHLNNCKKKKKIVKILLSLDLLLILSRMIIQLAHHFFLVGLFIHLMVSIKLAEIDPYCPMTTVFDDDGDRKENWKQRMPSSMINSEFKKRQSLATKLVVTLGYKLTQ